MVRSLNGLTTPFSMSPFDRLYKPHVLTIGTLVSLLPEFLALVALGCLLLAFAILPLSVEGEYRHERDPSSVETDTLNEDISDVDAACMAVPWFICIGFVLTYSALLAKLRRIKQIMDSSQHFRQIEVPRKNVIITIAVLLIAIGAILLTWTLVSPLQWDREVTDTNDLSGYPTESIVNTAEHLLLPVLREWVMSFLLLC